MSHFVLRPSVRSGDPPKGMFTADEYAAVQSFYGRERPTELHSLPAVATRLGFGELLLKDETSRLGLPAFKILGVSYAVERLRREGRLPPGTALACATDGNHGRAVARTAARLGLESHIFLPRHASPRRIEAIAGEGAHIHVATGNYDDAVRQAAREAQAGGWLVVSDTSWPGYEEIPRWIMCGYTQMLTEAARQWIHSPDVVFVQAGVGGLACAVASWFAHQYGKWRPFLVCCQAAASACVVEAVRVGKPTTLTGSLETVMDCLSAGEVSHSAWPVLAACYDAFMTVEDSEAVGAAELLRHEGIRTGPSGACGMAAVCSVMREDRLAPLREAFGMDQTTRVLVIATEGGSN